MCLVSTQGIIPTQASSTFCRVQGLGSGKQIAKYDVSRINKGHITPSNQALFPNQL